MRTLGLMLATILFFGSGCASDQPESEADRLWKQGYGYNNPNADRLRNGEPPVNFDGTID